MLKTHNIFVKIILNEEMLGTSPNTEEIFREYKTEDIPSAELIEEEAAAIIAKEFGNDMNPDKTLTIFSKDSNGDPIMWDYQLKGFFKDACGMLQKVTGKDEETGRKKKAVNESGKLSSYKKVIDGLIFTYPRKIPIIMPEGGEIHRCKRPLRASTPQGERVALSDSETVPEGSYLILKIACFNEDHFKQIYEWLDYGEFRGLGQWRNSGKGRFHYKEISEEEYSKFYDEYNSKLS